MSDDASQNNASKKMSNLPFIPRGKCQQLYNNETVEKNISILANPAHALSTTFSQFKYRLPNKTAKPRSSTFDFRVNVYFATSHFSLVTNFWNFVFSIAFEN